jgi:hypothetical protein
MNIVRGYDAYNATANATGEYDIGRYRSGMLNHRNNVNIVTAP